MIEDIMVGIISLFELFWCDFFEKEYLSEWCNFFLEFSGGFLCGYLLCEKEIIDGFGFGLEGEWVLNLICLVLIKWSFFSYWFVLIFFVYYWEFDLQVFWNGDFVYLFGYNDWYFYMFSFIYVNYGGNWLNLNCEVGEKFLWIEEGGIMLVWKFVILKKIQYFFMVYLMGGFGGSIGYMVVLCVFDLVLGESIYWKEKVLLNFKYIVYKWWYVSYSFNYFLYFLQKQFWDFDFIYGFGFFDWYFGMILIQYNNYLGNWYFWNLKLLGMGLFKDGGFLILILWVF